MSSPANPASQTNQSSNKTGPSFWNDLGKVGDNNTVYNMDQGNSDVGQLNEKTKALDKPLMTMAPVSNGSTGELTGDALTQRKS